MSCTKANASQAAHIRKGTDGGIGKKPSDCYTVPLCHKCHRSQHDAGELKFWYKFGGYEAAVVLAKKLYKNNDFEKAIELIVKFRRVYERQ